jgi:hypothetical protein
MGKENQSIRDAEPFECQLVCTTESLEDEFGDKVQVIVTVPWQGREVKVVKLPVSEEAREILLAAPAPFPIRRLLINFEVVDAESGEPLTKFEPPFELQVGYTANHWQSAREAGEDHPKLAFWDFARPEEEQRWVEFTPEKHDFRVEGDEEGGFLIATITDWGDPVHGGGP